MRHQGRIVNWNDSKGFGFVSPDDGGGHAFVHINAFYRRQRRPKEDDLITYEVSKDRQQRLRAEKIQFPGDSKESAARLGRKSIGLVFAFIFCCSVLILASLDKLPWFVLLVYAAASGIAFLGYAFDKSAAQNNRQRTPEIHLHILGLLGGWPGALLGQKTFRHKSKKVSFQTIFRITVLINCGALGWLFTQNGASFLGMLFGGQ